MAKKKLEEYFKKNVGDVVEKKNADDPLGLSGNKLAEIYLKSRVRLPYAPRPDEQRRALYLPPSKVAEIVKEIAEHNSENGPRLHLRTPEQSAAKILEDLAKKNSYA
jgi:hypothetical protein